jgi:oleate hydratase
MSVVLSYKPYFLDQSDDISLCWGYGLRSEEKGNFIKKKMSECTGYEILIELIHHLGFEDHLEEIMEKTVCIPCTTPYVTSQFLPRKISDRPLVKPRNALNFAFMGQYCELPKDVVFTVEYSVRSAQSAVYSLFGLYKQVPPIYNGFHHIRVIYNALKTIIR